MNTRYTPTSLSHMFTKQNQTTAAAAARINLIPYRPAQPKPLSIKLHQTSSSNAVVKSCFPSPNSFSGGDGINGGGAEGGGGGGGGGGGEGEEGEEERSEGEKPMIGSPEIGRLLDRLRKYPRPADDPGETPYTLDDLGLEPDNALLCRGLGRFMADEFLAKILSECGDDGLFPKNAAVYQQYKEKMLKELEVAAADVMRF